MGRRREGGGKEEGRREGGEEMEGRRTEGGMSWEGVPEFSSWGGGGKVGVWGKFPPWEGGIDEVPSRYEFSTAHPL